MKSRFELVLMIAYIPTLFVSCQYESSVFISENSEENVLVSQFERFSNVTIDVRACGMDDIGKVYDVFLSNPFEVDSQGNSQLVSFSVAQLVAPTTQTIKVPLETKQLFIVSYDRLFTLDVDYYVEIPACTELGPENPTTSSSTYDRFDLSISNVNISGTSLQPSPLSDQTDQTLKHLVTKEETTLSIISDVPCEQVLYTSYSDWDATAYCGASVTSNPWSDACSFDLILSDHPANIDIFECEPWWDNDPTKPLGSRCCYDNRDAITGDKDFCKWAVTSELLLSSRNSFRWGGSDFDVIILD